MATNQIPVLLTPTPEAIPAELIPILRGEAAEGGGGAIDAVPTDGSTNPVSSNGVFDALSGKSDNGHNHSGTYDPAGTAASAAATAQSNAISTASSDATTKANAAQAAAIAASTPAAHAGSGGTAHANAVAAGAAGFMTGADKTKLDGIAAGAQVNPASTDALTEGATNLYHTASRVLGQVLTGLSTAAGTVVEATHTILQAIGFLQKQVSDNTTAIGGKQATLVSGTNIKTINSTTLLGSGDLTVSASPGGSTTQVQYNSAGAFAGASGITTTGTELAIASGTKTTSAPVLDLSQTWNAAGVTFTAQKTNITDTASAAGSMLRDYQVGGVSRFSISKGVNSGALYGIEVNSGDVSSGYSAPTKSQISFGYKTTGFNHLIATQHSGAGYGNRMLVYLSTGGGSQTPGTNNALAVGVSNSELFVPSTSVLGFMSGTALAALDTGIARDAAGVAKITDGGTSNLRDLKLRNLIASGGVVTYASFTVATLPSASTSGAGAQAFVTDANATTPRSTVAGGGSNKVNVFSDGTNWLIAA